MDLNLKPSFNLLRKTIHLVREIYKKLRKEKLDSEK